MQQRRVQFKDIALTTSEQGTQTDLIEAEHNNSKANLEASEATVAEQRAQIEQLEKELETLREQLKNLGDNAPMPRKKRERAEENPESDATTRSTGPSTSRPPAPSPPARPSTWSSTDEENSDSDAESTSGGSGNETDVEVLTGLEYTRNRYALGAMLTSTRDQVIQNSVRRHGLRYISRFFTVYVYTQSKTPTFHNRTHSPGDTTGFRYYFDSEVNPNPNAGARGTTIAYPSAHVVISNTGVAGGLAVRGAFMFTDERANAIEIAFADNEADLPDPLPDPVNFRRMGGVVPSSIARAIGRGVERPGGPHGKLWVNVFIEISRLFSR